ncbi:MAG: nucleoside deaminase [Alloprevotella sp.]|nr:nucleoside deaminase [Bacteroidales bacterium]MDY2974708.1 nucleoside deaminase [Alloprevotella sp.]MDD6075397.1 nucleoside deaminase [Bacteroidales bacterium]MDD6501493.1 nucleoside deaminase [Bacteroidales bacterium]MDD6538720.1 nucleoside deaminase [Bacteroidales bacterium]
MKKEELMRRAIALAVENVRQGGGPFGAVIARNGEIIAEGVNRVTAHNDPTAHAEVQAIRAACEKLSTFDLSDCEIYASCEPCPMCLGAIYWARLHHLYFAATQHDAAEANFDDAFIYREIALPHSLRHLPTERMTTAEAGEPFRLWNAKTDKVAY